MQKTLLIVSAFLFLIILQHKAYSQIERKVTFELYKKDFDLGTDYPYVLKEIIVAQEEQEYVGKSFDGIYYSFPHPIGKSLSDFFHQQIHYDSKKKPLIVKINRLTVHGGNEYSSVDLSVTFYTEEDGRIIELIQTGVFHNESWGNLFGEYPRKHAKAVLNAFKECFLDLKVRGEKNTFRNNEISEDELYRVAELNEINFPVLSERSVQKGLFFTYSDFIDHNIDPSIDFAVNRKNEKHSNMQIQFMGDSPDRFWGGYDGENYFVKMENSIFPFEIEDDRFFILLNSKDFGSSADMNGLFFGALGYGLTKAIESGTSQIVKKEFDIYSGMIVSNKKEVVLKNSSSKKWEEVCILERDEVLACIKKGEYFKYPFRASSGIIRLTLKSGNRTKEIYFNPLQEQLIGIKQNEQGLKLVDYFTMEENNLALHLQKFVGVSGRDVFGDSTDLLVEPN